MDYKDVFAFRDDENQSDYALKDYEYLIEKYNNPRLQLDENFNLKYFLSKLVIDTDVLNIDEFFEYHFDYCDYPEKYFKVLEFKVVPALKEIIEDFTIQHMGHSYHKEKPLEDGFVATEGVIKKHTFEINYFKHYTAVTNKKHELQKKLDILNSYVNANKAPSRMSSLKWIAGPAKLGVLFQELIDKGYLEGPKNNGETNYRALAKELQKIFNIKNEIAESTLSLYLNPNSKKNIQARRNFDFVLFNN